MSSLSLFFSFFTFLFFLSFSAFSQSPLNRPSNIGLGVFVDFIDAEYEMNFSQITGAEEGEKQYEINVVSSVMLNQLEDGYILFDLNQDIQEVKIDGVVTNITQVKTPNHGRYVSQFHQVSTLTDKGSHTLEVKSKMQIWTKNFGLWLNDWADREMLELYVVSNLQYDQYPMTFSFNDKDFFKDNYVFTNGTEVEDEDSIIAQFPEFSNASSVFLHLVPSENLTGLYETTYSTLDGREMNVTLYSDNQSYSSSEELEEIYKKRVVPAVKDLEETWGPWPHESLVLVFDQCGRSMEHSGAARICRYAAIEHELTHSYWGRSIFPADGNSSWFDEGIATWIDHSRIMEVRSSYIDTDLSNNGEYFRATNQSSYTSGARFLIQVGYLLNAEEQVEKTNNALMTKCMKSFYDKYAFKTMTSQNILDHIVTDCSDGTKAEEIRNLFTQYIF